MKLTRRSRLDSFSTKIVDAEEKTRQSLLWLVVLPRSFPPAVSARINERLRQKESMPVTKHIHFRFLAPLLAALALASSGCKDHPTDHSAHKGSPSDSHQAPHGQPAAALAPAEGAKVKILTPGKDQVFTGDEIPLHFELTKGKRGEHVHAYVDGEMAGMFKTTKGTLTGIRPGNHTLEVRVVTADHNIELDATDQVHFVVK